MFQPKLFRAPDLRTRAYLDPDRLHGIWNLPKPQIGCQLQGFLGLAGYYGNWFLSFSLMTQPFYALLRNTKPDPITWENQDDLAFNTLRESLIILLSLDTLIINFTISSSYMRRETLLEYLPPNMSITIAP